MNNMTSIKRFGKIVVQNRNYSSAMNFQEHVRNELINFLEKKSKTFFNVINQNSIYPSPFLVSASELKSFEKIHYALNSAIKCTVNNYDRDQRIQKVYEFPPNVKKILDLYHDVPYVNIGAYRPDFLHDGKDNNVKICEINARFPTNGYLITYFGNDFYESKNSFNIRNDNNIHEIYQSYKKEFDVSKPICILKNKEKGYDINFLKEFFDHVFYVNPNELIFDSNKLIIQANGNKIQVDQFILELHQDEILLLKEQILSHMIKSCKLLNDLRTIFFAHDKRFLNILSRDDILFDYLDPDHHRTIRDHRINTILTSDINSNSNLKKKIIESKNCWLIKPALLGKGEGILFGKDLNDFDWSHLINNMKNSDLFIIQEYLKQKKFNLNNKNVYVVGTLLCLNDTFYGPGIYRASSKDLVSITKTGLLLFPQVGIEDQIALANTPPVFSNHKKFQIPKECFHQVYYFTFKNADLYQKALNKYGCVLLDVKFQDPRSSFLMSLLNVINMKPCSHSGKNNDFLWDIKPLTKLKDDRPRSHTSEIFQMHTDASYEFIPPRYFALKCVHRDQFNGGQNLLIKLKDILERLTENEVELLRKTKVKIKIPKEFRSSKSKFNCIESTILSSNTSPILVRYRHDILLENENLSIDYKKALEKFENLIDMEKSDLIKYFNLEDNQILLVDNSRWLHGRTKIFDVNRHFVRVRFNDKNCLDNDW